MARSSNSLSASRPRRKTRTRRANRAGRLVAAFASLALVLGAACTSAPPKATPPPDVEGASSLAAGAAAILLRLSAYDYALAGTLSGDRTYVVSPDRYAAVVRGSVAQIQRFAGGALKLTLDARGPIRERLVTLADGMVDLSRDATAYADGGDPALFARVAAGVARSWEDLRAFQRLTKQTDDEVARSIERGSSIVVSGRTLRVRVVSVGPFATLGEAQQAAARIGGVEQVSRTSPFVVRVGSYLDKAAADTTLARLAALGFTGLATEEERFVFTRSGPAPDVELWREPQSTFEAWAAARRVAVSPQAKWVATGSDDGTVAIFTADGVLRSLPKFNAGVSHLAFSSDGAWLMGGGQTLANFILPDGVGIGVQARLPSPASQLVYVPRANYFAAIAKGSGGETGEIEGRAPDGAPLRSFPISVPASGGALAASARGELYIATNTLGTTDVEVLDLTRDRQMRGVLRVPGSVRAIAVDPTGSLGAVMTDQGVFRFGPHDPDPAKTLKRIGDAVSDLAFGPDGTLYLLAKTRLSAHDLHGEQLWQASLVDARKLVIASRPVVLDGADRLVTFDAKGVDEDLGVTGSVQDVSASPDGRHVAVLAEGSRALIFKLP